MAEATKPKLILVYPEGDAQVQRLSRALAAFGEVEEIVVTPASPLNLQELWTQKPEAKHLFLHYDCAKSAGNLAGPFLYPITLFQSTPTPLIEMQTGAHPLLETFRCLVIENMSVVELMRLTMMVVNPAVTSGVHSLFEKGALILGEKIESTEKIGHLLDVLCQYVREEHEPLAQRSADIRLVVTGLTEEALKRNAEAESAYSAVDIQACASKDKFAFTLRFPAGTIDPKDLAHNCFSANFFAWHMAWQACDALVATYISGSKEFEVKAVIYTNSPRRLEGSFHTFSLTTVESEVKSQSLLGAPKNYTYSHASEVLVSKGKSNRGSLVAGAAPVAGQETEEKELDPATKMKITTLQDEVKNLREELLTKSARVKEALEKLKTDRGELDKRTATVAKAFQTAERERLSLKKQVEDLEAKLTLTQQQLVNAKADGKPDDAISEQLAEATTKLRAMEHQAMQVNEQMKKEKERATTAEEKQKEVRTELLALDKKFTALSTEHKETLRELEKAKAALAQASPKANTSADANAANAAQDPKAMQRAFDQKEADYVKKIKELTFKVEQNEKMKGASKGEQDGKAKLLEKNLNDAKQKEVALLKKIEELETKLKRAGGDKDKDKKEPGKAAA